MKKYIKPTTEPISVEGTEIMYAMSLQIFDDSGKCGMDIEDYTITDGSQVLMPRHNKLWDAEEGE